MNLICGNCIFGKGAHILDPEARSAGKGFLF